MTSFAMIIYVFGDPKGKNSFSPQLLDWNLLIFFLTVPYCALNHKTKIFPTNT